jgi:hypothetical protein
MTNQTTNLQSPLRYEVTNNKTGKVSTFKTGRAASSFMDRTDNAYGACICTRRAIWSDEA